MSRIDKKLWLILLMFVTVLGTMPGLFASGGGKAYAATKVWEPVGSPRFSEGRPDSISMYVDDGVPYVAYLDLSKSSKAIVKKYNSDQKKWVSVGDPEGVSAGAVESTSLVVYQGTPYLAFIDKTNNKAKVLKYDNSANKWDPVGNVGGVSTGTAGYTSLFLENGTLYLAYLDYVSSPRTISVKKYVSSNWEPVGDFGALQPSASGFPLSFGISLYVSKGNPYIVYGGATGGGMGTNPAEAYVKMFDGTKWKDLGGVFNIGGPGNLKIYVDNDIPYLAYQDGIYYDVNKTYGATVKKYVDGGWQAVGKEKFTAQQASSISFVIYKGTPYVAFVDGNFYNNRISVMKFKEKEGWVYVGDPGVSESYSVLSSLYINNDTVYVAYSDGSVSLDQKTTVMKYVEFEAAPPTVTSYSPASLAKNVPINSDLTLTFSENVKAAAGKKIYIHKASDDSVSYTLDANNITTVAVSGNIVKINPDMIVPDNKGYLKYDTPYYVLIEAGAFTNDAGTPYAGINDKTVWSFTTVAGGLNPPKVPLDAPSEVKTSNVTTNSVKVSWKPVKGAAKYIVYVDGKPTSPVTVPNAVLTGLTPPGSEHKFSVVAVSEDDIQSERSGEVSAKLLSIGVPYLDSTEYQLNIGEKHQTVVSVVYPDNTVHEVTSMFTFKSTNEQATTVNSTGLVTAVGGGQTSVIQAVYTDASSHTTTLQANVTVVGVLDHLELNIPEKLIKGKTYDSIVTAVYVPPAKPEDVTEKATYESSDPSVITVDQTGRIQVKGKGTATITVKYGGKTVTKTITVVDAIYDMNFTATPSSIVADGKSQVTLRVTLKSVITGEAMKGVPVVLHFGNGTLADQKVITDEKGVAILTFTVPASHSTKPMTETIVATATDPASQISQSEKVNINYTPAEIAGVVTDNEGKPVADAIVTIESVNGFVVTVKTGPDGTYRVPVVDGNIDYKVTIQISLKVNGKTVTVTTTQTANVGQLNGAGQTFKSDNRISGQLAVNSGNSNNPQELTLDKLFGAGNVSAVVRPIGDDKTEIASVKLDNNGNFSVNKLPQGQYRVSFMIEAGGKPLVGPSISVTLTDNAGQTGFVFSLIDPYGVVTDSAGKPVSGVNMKLYWADTQLNKDKGRIPNTLVDLPILPNFEPNQNKNTQVTNTAGEYAWMVFPDGDYYIVAEKSGYFDYSTTAAKVNQPTEAGSDSYIKDGIIHVGQDIVKLDFTLTAIPTSSSTRSSGSSGTGGTANNVPTGLAAGKVTSTSATLSWNAVSGAESYNIYDNGKLLASGVKGTTYDLTGLLAGSKHVFTVTSLVNGSESQPSAALDLTTAEETGHHEKYIEGYPDGTFSPERNVSREEFAMILYRLYHLAGTAKASDIGYTDVTAADWSALAIAAVMKAGYMDGYPDGSFLPKNQISREEMASVVARLNHLQGSDTNAFPDTADSWARQAIAAAAQAGIMKGYEDGGFRIKAKTTRAEVVTIMNRLTNRGPLVGITTPTWSDVPQNHWAFGHVEEASRDHDYIFHGTEEYLSTVIKQN